MVVRRGSSQRWFEENADELMPLIEAKNVVHVHDRMLTVNCVAVKKEFRL